MHITPVTDKRFALFSKDDRQFLQGVFQDHPQIGQNFADYLDVPAGEARETKAQNDLKKLLRKGWVIRKIPDPESVFTHTQDLLGRAQTATPPELDKAHVLQMIKYHDLPEVIITDLTPHAPFYHDKARLEELAMKVIMEKTPEENKAVALIREYAEQKTPESQWVHDLDKLDAVFKALKYESRYPQKIRLFKEFANHAIPRLKTDKGKLIGEYLMAQSDMIKKSHDCFSR